jgi:hypothetical protein
MSGSRRRSGRGKGGGNNAGANANGGNPPKGGGQGGGGKKAKKQADFWEVPGASAKDLAAAVRVPDDPTALVRSLGAPSLPGQGGNAEHYFTAVYEKASHVAFALATANGLLEDALVAGEGDDGDVEAAADDPVPADS